jgi:dipeptidyl aminopeptidase/acylaminoacyl peptidase
MGTRIISRQSYRGGFSDEVPPDEQERLKKRLATVDVEKIVYRSLDGLEIPGFVVRPKDASGDLPCIIFNRGGNNDFGAINTAMIADWWVRLVDMGHVVIGSQYRGTETEGKDEFGGADLQDVLALKDVLEEIDGADAARIGMFGFSRGGMMTYLAMREVDWIDAAVTVGAPVDLEVGLKDRPEMREVYKRAFGATKEGMRQRSVIEWVDELPKDVPIMIMHGADDWRVDPERTKDFVEKLADANIDHRFKLFEGAGHALEGFEDEVFALTEEWFEGYV